MWVESCWEIPLYQLDEGSEVEKKSMSSHWNSQVYMEKRNRRDSGAGQLGLGSLQLHRWKEQQRNSVFSGIWCFLSRLRFMSRDGQVCGGVTIIFNSRPLLWCLEFESFTSVLRELNECHSSGVPNCFLQRDTLLEGRGRLSWPRKLKKLKGPESSKT